MYVNERDQINYHGFLRALREMNQVSQEIVSKGICTVSGMNRFENGNRVAEKLMRDRLTARLGISGEKYEDYLQPKEYVRWEHRLRIVKAIEKKDFVLAEKELDAYRELPKLNCVNHQFVEAMQFLILSGENAPQDALLECITKAIKCTVSNVGKALEGAHLLSDQEMNLIAEYMRLCPAKKTVRDEVAWRISEYEKLIAYMDASCWEKLQKAKMYPKVVYYICKLMLENELTEERCRRGLELCYHAIELLRDTCRLYYFIELTEMRKVFAEFLLEGGVKGSEATDLEAMIQENETWKNVFNELYAEYKVEPYMSDFCYLYYETECHDMVEVIESRRTMLGLSRVKLGEGICTDKTIVRFEREGRNPNIDLVRLLFERMGLCAEYRRTRFVSNDVETVNITIEIAKSINNRDICIWEENLNKLKRMLDLNIAQNKQQISRYEVLLNYRKKLIDKAMLYKGMVESLEMTLPQKALFGNKNKHFTRNEITCLNDLAFKYKGDLSAVCMELIKQRCLTLETEMLNVANICAYEYMTNNLASYLGDEGELELSLKLSYTMMKECLTYRRSLGIPNHLYNILWNHQNEMEEACVKKMIEKCLSISVLLKRDSKIAFFQKKIDDYHSISSSSNPS